MKAAYIIARAIFPGVDDPAKATGPLAEYFAGAPKSVANFGGEYVVRGGRSQLLEGLDHFSPCIILKFPSYEAALNWYNSNEYTRLKKLRQGHADIDVFLIEANQ
jgi:uncharacterized protein (DUF1330 family)